MLNVFDIGKKLNRKYSTEKPSTKDTDGPAQIETVIQALQDTIRDNPLAPHIVAPDTMATLKTELQSVQVGGMIYCHSKVFYGPSY